MFARKTMFDIGLMEIVVIAVVAVIVVGPERLPKAVRTVAHLFGRAQRYVSDIKQDIQREIELDEIRNLKDSVKDFGNELKSTVTTSVSDLDRDLKDVGNQVKSTTSELNDAVASMKQKDTPGAAFASARAATNNPLPTDLNNAVELSAPETPQAEEAPHESAPDATPTATPDGQMPPSPEALNEPEIHHDEEAGFADGTLPVAEMEKLPEVGEAVSDPASDTDVPLNADATPVKPSSTTP